MPVSISTEGAIANILTGAVPAAPATGDAAFGLAFVQMAAFAAESTNSGAFVPYSAPNMVPQTLLPEAVIADSAPLPLPLDIEPQIKLPSAAPEEVLLIVQGQDSVAPEPVKKGTNKPETAHFSEVDADASAQVSPFLLPVAVQPIPHTEKQPTTQADTVHQNPRLPESPSAERAINLPDPLLGDNRPEQDVEEIRIVSVKPEFSKKSDFGALAASANMATPSPATPHAQPGAILPVSLREGLVLAPSLVAAETAKTPVEFAVSQPPLATRNTHTSINTVLASNTPTPEAAPAPADQGKPDTPVAREMSQPVPMPPAPVAKTDASGPAPAMPAPAQQDVTRVETPAPAQKPDKALALTAPLADTPTQDPSSAKPQPLPEGVAVASPDVQPAKEVSPRPVQDDAPPPDPIPETAPKPGEKPDPATVISGSDASPPPSSTPSRLPPLHTTPQPSMQHIAQALHHAPDGKLELVLTPHELGHLKMTLTPSDSGISVTILAERPETADLMRRHIDMLGQEFRELGYRDVRFDFGQGGQRQQAPQNTPSEGPQPAPTPPHAADQAPAPLRRDGLDIRI